jgi:hypothetical protein
MGIDNNIRLLEVNWEYDFGGSFDGGRSDVFVVDNYRSIEEARERIRAYFKKNIDGYDKETAEFLSIRHHASYVLN